MENYKCELCGRDYQYRTHKGKRDTKKYCHNCIIGRHHYAFRHACVQYKGGSCRICGYDKVRGLAFHHVNPAVKDFCVAAMSTLSRQRVQEELDKCVLLCSNCHSEVHGDLELLRLGFPESDLLLNVKEVHERFVPDKDLPFSRADWKKYHPVYVQRGNYVQ